MKYEMNLGQICAKAYDIEPKELHLLGILDVN